MSQTNLEIQNLVKEISKSATRVYSELGAGHEKAIYRDAISVELQDKGFTVKTEAPVSIRYNTSKGKDMIVGSGKIDLFLSCYVPHNNSLCLIDKEVLNYYRQLLNKQGGKQ